MAIVRVQEGYEPFLVNPIGRRVGRKTRKKNAWKGHRKEHRDASALGWWRRQGQEKGTAKTHGAMYPRNPLGEELLLVTNPKGGVFKMAKTKKHNATKKGSHKRRHNPVMRTSQKRRHHRRHNRYHNPIMGGAMFTEVLAGMFSGLANSTLPIALKATRPASKYAIQAASAIAGGMLLKKAFNAPNAARMWTVVGLSLLGADLFKEFVLKKVTLMTAAGPVAIPQGTPVAQVAGAPAAPAAGMGAYMDELNDNFSLTLGQDMF